eukprot:CAMPEP_0117425840 /NCGR_PEP_ID=MMETSP0758-20121206/6062_1 /TAXON_ID=63605 /ORGANISM="Percolomonas cosmopolitus, Strain AE-1 (ATCC 50343)" /LENGTH=284 /DNA_ID=CAMNT_0005210627 /DNA_START=210 /DNA_END=1065 /DNA_ORIENTATION=-
MQFDKSEKFDNTALTLGLLEDLQEITYEENVQAVEADDVELLADAESTTEVSSKFKSGSKLRATTAVRVRSGPCTNKKTLTTVPSGGKVTFKGAAQNGCGYKWIKVSGSFGTGWTAENFWTKSSSGGGSSGANCKNPVHFPEFRQCDNRWRNNKLGSKTICAIGCLMSSVSMGLNGHNRKINGQASNPATLNSYLSSHGGYSGNLFIWGSVSKFGFSFAGKYSATSARAYVCSKSHVVILNVRNGGHWVLATGLTSTGFTVNDPAGYTSHYTNGQVVTTGVYKV